jgi:hypothetical protein
LGKLSFRFARVSRFSMEHPLKALLQFQLASDASTTTYLPQILGDLSPQCFDTSSHNVKWTIRINSLLHSKDAAARWSACCLARQTALLSQPILLECAQTWIGVALPILSVRRTIQYYLTEILTLFCSKEERTTASPKSLC